MPLPPTQFERLQTVKFQNLSGESAPPFACLAVTGKKLIDGESVYTIIKPDTTLRTLGYIFNGLATIEDGSTDATKGFGVAYRGADITAALSSTGTAGDSFGVKPDSWLLWPGYPALGVVQYEWDTTNHFATVNHTNFSQLLAKTSDAWTADTATDHYTIWQGDYVGGGDAGFTSVPMAMSHLAIDNGKFVWLTFVNNFVRGVADECNG